MRFRSVFVALLLIFAAAAAGYWILYSSPQSSQQRQAGPGGRRSLAGSGPAPVTVAHVTKQSVPVYREGIGNVTALNIVTVHSQVDGRLLSVEYKEGQDVKKGDVLARIDPVTFKAAYDQAVAKKAQDEANLANAKLDLERYRNLARTHAGPQQQADQQEAMVAQLTAQVESDKAAIDNAKAVLDYTTVVSPIDGRIGLRLMDPGNIVHAADATGLVSITQIRPITVVFTLPQRDLAVTVKAQAAGAVKVEIPSSDTGAIIATGTLLSTDNQIDTSTGTIKLKAIFDNGDQALWPGQFVSARVVVDTLKDAMVVPVATVRLGPSGNFVYVIDSGNKAHVRPVVVTLQNDTIAVLKSGVTFDDQVVTEGFARLTEGADVTINGESPSGAPGSKKGAKSGQSAAVVSPAAPGGDGGASGTAAIPSAAAAVTAPGDAKSACANPSDPNCAKGRRGGGKRKRDEAATRQEGSGGASTSPKP